jgi:ribosomal protein S27E
MLSDSCPTTLRFKGIKLPALGEIANSKDTGHPYSHKQIYAACEDCGKERWVFLKRNLPEHIRCRSCGKIKAARLRKEKGISRSKFGTENCHWKGGKQKDKDGYISLLIYPGDTYFPMANRVRKGGAKLILEHRLVMAKHLNRFLLKTEHVHHINGIKDDNRIENLELISQSNHVIYKQMCADCELRKEIRLLRWQIKELSQQLQEKLKL